MPNTHKIAFDSRWWSMAWSWPHNINQPNSSKPKCHAFYTTLYLIVVACVVVVVYFVDSHNSIQKLPNNKFGVRRALIVSWRKWKWASCAGANKNTRKYCVITKCLLIFPLEQSDFRANAKKWSKIVFKIRKRLNPHNIFACWLQQSVLCCCMWLDDCGAAAVVTAVGAPTSLSHHSLHTQMERVSARVRVYVSFGLRHSR